MDVLYRCDNCGRLHDVEENIWTCKKCGCEICRKCCGVDEVFCRECDLDEVLGVDEEE